MELVELVKAMAFFLAMAALLVVVRGVFGAKN
jgi:hypothetical protein